MKRFLLFLALASASASAHAQVVQKRTLPNGLTVLAQENHASPVVSVRIYVKTGSIYEDQFLGAGLSHLFEHTLFEGTKTRNKKALNDEIQAIGGQSNAYTSYDVTCYYITTASPYFGRALDVLADMTQNATFPENEIKVQQGVIHNEMNLGEDDPGRALSELFSSTAFRVHPARYPIIGFKPQFDKISRDDIISYYKSHYTPGNAVLSIAGDVSAPAVFDRAEKEFGNWERQAPQALALPAEPLQSSPRRAVVEQDVNLTYLQMGWHTIPLQSPDLYALDTLAQILGGGESSRLVREVQENQNLVSSIAAFSGTPNYDAGIFGIRAVMPPKNISKAERSIKTQVEKIKKNGVSEAELVRAKRQIRAAFIFGKQGVENQAEQNAYDELGTGDPTYSTRYVNRIAGVSVAQVKAVANKYLLSDGLTTAIIKPRLKAAKATKNEGKPAAPRAIAGNSKVPAPKVVTLPNGVKLVLRPNKSAPTVSIVAMGLGGVRLENSKQGGISSLAAQMLTRGTTKRSAEQIAGLVDDLGGSLSGFTGYNAWGIESNFLASDWRRGLNLVAESALHPTFPSSELAKVKAQTLDAIAAQDDDPMSSASILLRKTFFGSHPYGRNTLGTTQSVKSIDRAQLAAFWNSVLQPKSTVLTVSGQFDPKQVEAVARMLFGSYRSQTRLPKAPGAVTPPPSFTLGQKTRAGLTQSVLWYGFPAVNLKSEDRYALDVLDAALSGADLPGGRLHERLRNNQLVYVVHAYDSPALDGGMFVIYAATEPKNKATVRQIIEEEVQKVRDADISPEELERAKTMMISAHAIDLQTNADQARDLASNQLFGLGVNSSASYAAKINKITLKDVRRVANQYLNLENAALATVDPS
ncbi:zinc protease [Abditibacterium utsteinense]|uniref:Zinc protease n=1 Tax=Abditibacterium utsteinense TaxID=1960156 RepID=A0A2S8SX90_9BACT|nr:pitrilysin family protein [Abditibacterium utsteinense]PQV65369.1 zinc protease [Abditibacterium utsteinense]